MPRGAPTWREFAERAGIEVAPSSPAAELAGVLQRYRADLDEAARAGASSRANGLRVLAEQAVLAVQLEQVLEGASTRALEDEEIRQPWLQLKDRMLAQIRACGLEIVRLAGATARSVDDLVDVECWRHDDAYASEVVAEELEIAVRFGGTVVRRGRVVMGAPRST